MYKLNFKNVSIVSLSIFLLSGILGTLPLLGFLPLKPLSVIFPAIYIISYLVKNLRVPKTLFFIFPWVITLIPSFYVSNMTDYSKEKIINLLIILLVTTTSSAFLLRNKDDLFTFLNSLAIIGLIIAVFGLFNFGTIQSELRLAIGDSNPIWLSRAVSFSFAWFFILYMHKKISLISLAILGTIILIVMLGTGSKGPLFALLFSLLIVFTPSFKTLFLKSKTYFFIFIAPIFLYAFYYIALKVLPYYAVMRFADIFTNDSFDSGRMVIWQTALDLITINPLGIGIGHFVDYSYFPYPHNIILESFVEGGWIFGIYLIGMLIVTFLVIRRLSLSGNYIYQAVYTLMLISLINAMVSGDLISPKELYITITLGFSLIFTRELHKNIQRNPNVRTSTSH